MLKDAALRKKMSDLGLSTNGNRMQLEKRHKEWVTIWNANCDSARPKRRAELLHDLDVWERTQGAKAPVFAARPGAAVKDKEFDGAAWAAKHDTSFKDLIANARKSRAQARQKTEQAAVDGSAEESKTARPAASEDSGVEVAMGDLTEGSTGTRNGQMPGNDATRGVMQGFPVAHPPERIQAAGKPHPPSAMYYMQDGFSEQIPPGGARFGK